MVTLHHGITIWHEMFDDKDGVMRALENEKPHWKEDLYFAFTLAHQKLSKSYAAVTPAPGMLLIPAHILDPFWKLQSFRKWDKGMDINPEDENSYTTQFQKVFLKYMENEYCAKQWRLPVIQSESVQCNNHFSSAMASRSGLSWHDV